MVEFLADKKVERNLDEMLAKDVDFAKAKVVLERAYEKLSALPDFGHAAIEAALRPFVEEVGAKAGSVFGVLRIAVMGKKVTPPLFESLAALGKEETLRRISEARELVNQK